MLPGIASVTILTAVSFIILMCYGGGFGTMPAFAADYFGSKNVGPIYGLMLTAWGSASAFGPLLIAHLRQASGSYVSGLHIIAGVMAVSSLCRRPKPIETACHKFAETVCARRRLARMRTNDSVPVSACHLPISKSGPPQVFVAFPDEFQCLSVEIKGRPKLREWHPALFRPSPNLQSSTVQVIR
jgi:hypothetical protein